jgi:hypothetical protein
VTPVSNFGFVDLESGVVSGRQARDVTDGTVDVGDGPAGAAHHVVMVVADTGLIADDGSRRLKPPDQAGGCERPQHVVDGLMGDIGKRLASRRNDCVRGCVRRVVYRRQHGHPGLGHPKAGAAQHPLSLSRGG